MRRGWLRRLPWWQRWKGSELCLAKEQGLHRKRLKGLRALLCRAKDWNEVGTNVAVCGVRHLNLPSTVGVAIITGMDCLRECPRKENMGYKWKAKENWSRRLLSSAYWLTAQLFVRFRERSWESTDCLK